MDKNGMLHLPHGYSVRDNNQHYLDTVGAFIYQPHVYELAAFLAQRSQPSRIIDIGSGSGEKLQKLQDDYEIVCIDTKEALHITNDVLPKAMLIKTDLNNGLAEIDNNIFKDAIVICSDVVEHLQTPNLLAQDLAQLKDIASFIILSTPDRIRARGPLDLGPPSNLAHTLEWSIDELARFLSSNGFSDDMFMGHTINTDYHRAKITSLSISGKEISRPLNGQRTSVAAIINTYNEIDIIEEVIHHLIRQGVEVHIFDNWSNDGTWEVLTRLKEEGLVKAIDRFPSAPTQYYEWYDQLKNVEDYITGLSAEWIIHHDADELRYSPWKDITLAEAFHHVGKLGYNAVDFTLLNFRFTKNQKTIKGNYENKLPFFEFGSIPGHFLQVKAFQKKDKKINIADSGGHDIIFDGRKVYPIKFLTKHYPLRSKEQAEKKLFYDRLPRYEKERTKLGWHTQYNSFAQEKEILGWEHSKLISWHQAHFETEYLVERLSGIGLHLSKDESNE